MLSDKYGRQFSNLRVSLTAACNYACTYCVPGGNRRHKAKRELSAEQMIRSIDLVRKVTNVDRLRITGGEPLIASSFDQFLEMLAVETFDDVSLTTNGQKLAEKIDLIVDAGIQRVNISLDTLDASAFRDISLAGDLASVLKGIDVCLEKGLKVKINMVPIRSANIDQILPLLDYSLERGIELRFIELMRMGHLAQSALHDQDMVPMEFILREIGRRHEFHRIDAPFDSTAVRFEVIGKGVFGIIANESEPFCSSCNRLRLSSSGYLHGCLSSENKYSLFELLDLPEQQALRKLNVLLASAMGDKQEVFRGGETVMRLIGG